MMQMTYGVQKVGAPRGVRTLQDDQDRLKTTTRRALIEDTGNIASDTLLAHDQGDSSLAGAAIAGISGF